VQRRVLNQPAEREEKKEGGKPVTFNRRTGNSQKKEKGGWDAFISLLLMGRRIVTKARSRSGGTSTNEGLANRPRFLPLSLTWLREFYKGDLSSQVGRKKGEKKRGKKTSAVFPFSGSSARKNGTTVWRRKKKRKGKKNEHHYFYPRYSF